MRILFALPGLHRCDRGAEIAFISVANELAKVGDAVTLIGSGRSRDDTSYSFISAASIDRTCFEAFPSVPMLRNECGYEELTFVPGLLRNYVPSNYDVTITCSYPFTNWVLRRPAFRGYRPAHIFVTQNGDWPAYAQNSEYKFFDCEGLVCTNPDFYERNKARWRCQLIPNGVDCTRFRLGPPRQAEFGLPVGQTIVLMVSALIPSKQVALGVEAVARLPNTHLVVAGDGPLRRELDATAARVLPGRFTRLSVTPDRMPALYNSADVFLHLSKEEAFGNVFLEALASGLPIVGYDTSRIRWIVGSNEFLANTDNPAEIANQITRARAADHSCQSERLRRAATFSWRSIGQQYRTFVHNVVASHPRQ